MGTAMTRKFGTRVTLLALATLAGSGCRDDPVGPGGGPWDGGPAFQIGDAVRLTGIGSIGDGEPLPGSNYQSFDLDVRNDLTGALLYADYGVVRPDGTVATLRVDPLDSETAITAFRDGSAACDDPALGVEFDGTGRLDTGEVVGFTVITCDYATPGVGFDLFWIEVPSHAYGRRDRLSSGDLVKSTL